MKRLMVLFIFLFIGSGTVYSENTLLRKAEAINTEVTAKALIIEIKTNGGKDKELLLGIIYHNLAQANPGKYLTLALTNLLSGYNKTTNALAYGYYGSALTLEASLYTKKGKKNDFIKASSEVMAGSDIIDQMVKKEPDNIDLRFLRIGNIIAVAKGSPFKRYETARKDLDYLTNLMTNTDNYTKSCLYLWSGEIYMGMNQGKNAAENLTEKAIGDFEKAVDAAPDSMSAARAKTHLKELEE